MKNIYVLVILLATPLWAQLSDMGNPRSWTRTDMPAEIEAIQMPEMPAHDVLDKNPLNEKNGVALKFGEPIPVNYSLQNSGDWRTLPNGDRIWRLRIQSAGAKSLNFILDDYKLPAGAYLYLYPNDKSDLVGAYDAQSNNSENMLGTWLVHSDDVWLEYFEPASVKGLGSLRIKEVIHGFKDIRGALSTNKVLNSSGHCNHDVDCTVGNGWDTIKDDLKHSSALVVLGGAVCSGSLINNTAEDGTPYFLTANHCNVGSPAAWSFRFNWISPNPVCGTTASNQTSAVNHTLNGATLLATNSISDFRLLRLNTVPPQSWGLTWSGWDRTGTAPSAVMGIHHPSGDIMKVARDDNGPTAFNNNGVYWRINSGTQGGWELGVTEGGSSGSPLYNPNGQIIGQLWRGNAACSGTNDNGGSDDYGRFQQSWITGSFAQWLDPASTGATTLDYATQAQILLSTSEISPDKIDFAIYENRIQNSHFLKSEELISRVEIYSMDGRLLRNIEVSDQNLVNLTSAKLVSGKYNVVIHFANGQKRTSDFIKR